MMNRQMIITGIVFVVAGVITVVLLQWGFHVRGGVLKIIIGLVIALIAGAVAFFATRRPAPTQ